MNELLQIVARARANRVIRAARNEAAPGVGGTQGQQEAKNATPSHELSPCTSQYTDVQEAKPREHTT